MRCCSRRWNGATNTSSMFINCVDLVNPEHSFHPTSSGHWAIAGRVSAAIEGRVPTGESVGLVDPTSGIWNLRGDWGVVDGRDTPAVYRPSDRTVYFRYTLTEGNADSQFLWPGAEASWLPVAGGFNLSRGVPLSDSATG